MVSAIMPTSGRPEMAADAVSCFLCQSYADRELLIMDDSNAPSFPAGIVGRGIRYYQMPGGTIGLKRNRLCELASGEVIVHFDDDDYSDSRRIQDQVDRMLATGATVTGYNAMRFREGEDWWHYQGSEKYALGTSLCYRKWFWERTKFNELGTLPDGTLIPDELSFIARAVPCLKSVDAGDMMWASIHPGNSSPRLTSGAQWRKL